MSDFEFLAGFFGVLLGLIVVQLATKLAESIDDHSEYPLGLLTLLLAAFVLCDVTSFWIVTWSLRNVVIVSMASVFACTFLGIVYYLSAALVFPRVTGRWQSMDDHYWARKRIVLGGILLVNALVLGWQISRVIPQLTDSWFFVIQTSYYVPLVALMFTKRRWLDAVLLGWLLLGFVISASELFPNSHWGDASMLNNRPEMTHSPPVL